MQKFWCLIDEIDIKLTHVTPLGISNNIIYHFRLVIDKSPEAIQEF